MPHCLSALSAGLRLSSHSPGAASAHAHPDIIITKAWLLLEFRNQNVLLESRHQGVICSQGKSVKLEFIIGHQSHQVPGPDADMIGGRLQAA